MDCFSSETPFPATLGDTPRDLGRRPIASRSKKGRQPIEPQEIGSEKDHRRIQNRKAQRAYRQRKEQAIEDLKEKILQLEKSREELVTEFLSFTTIILKHDIVKNCPGIMEYVQRSTCSLLHSAAEIVDEGCAASEIAGCEVEQNMAEGGSDIDASTGTFVTPHPVRAEMAGPFDVLTTANDHGKSPRQRNGTSSSSDSTPLTDDMMNYFQLPVYQAQTYHENLQLPISPYSHSLHSSKSLTAPDSGFYRYPPCTEGLSWPIDGFIW